MKYLSHYVQEAQTALFNELGIFFAFGQEQFEEKRAPGVQYVQPSPGMLVPAHNVEKAVEGLEKSSRKASRLIWPRMVVRALFAGNCSTMSASIPAALTTA